MRIRTSIARNVLTVAVTAFAATFVSPVTLSWAESDSYLVGLTDLGNNRALMTVHSAAMNIDIPLEIQRSAATSPSPTVYLLNGSNGGVNGESWAQKSDVFDLLATKAVNLVTPIAGRSSYYTDWRQPDPEIGVNKWRTFLTEELPPVVNAALNTNGKNAIAGISMSGTSVLALAEYKPELYESVASFSGCANTSDVRGQLYVRLTVDVFGHANSNNMWGPPNDPEWVENDPYVHADRLRGVKLYISSATGLAGHHDVLGDPWALPGVEGLIQQYTLGGAIEAAVNDCTHGLKQRLDELGIPATFNFKPNGTHMWGYWRDDIHDAWPLIAESLHVPA